MCGGDHGQERAAEAGERAGDRHGDVLVRVDVDAERLGGDRVLAAGAQPQAERRSATARSRCRRTAATARSVSERQVGDQAAERCRRGRRPGTSGASPASPAGADSPGTVNVGQSGQRRRLLGRRRRRGSSVKSSLDRYCGDAGREDVDRDTGDDVVDAEGDGGDRVQQAAERAADDAAEQRRATGCSCQPAQAPNQGAEDHHAFEADVDHAGPLGPQAAEAGQADRHGAAPARRRSGPLEVMSSAPVMTRTARRATSAPATISRIPATEQPRRPPGAGRLGRRGRRGVGRGGGHAVTSCLSVGAAACAASSRADLLLLALEAVAADELVGDDDAQSTMTPWMIADDLLVVCRRTPGSCDGCVQEAPRAARRARCRPGCCGRAARCAMPVKPMPVGKSVLYW